MINLLIFGNGIAWGIGDPAGGWATRLGCWFKKQTTAVVVYNLGVCGNTSADLLNRFQPEFLARRNSVEPNPIIFSVGLDDTARRQRRSRTRVSLSNFRQNIEDLLAQALAYNEKIVFLGLINIWEERMADRFTAKGGWWYSNKTIAKYNKELKNICAQYSLPFIDLFGLLAEKDLSQADGVYPNAQGHEKIFKTVKHFLIGQKFISF